MFGMEPSTGWGIVDLHLPMLAVRAVVGFGIRVEPAGGDAGGEEHGFPLGGGLGGEGFFEFLDENFAVREPGRIVGEPRVREQLLAAEQLAKFLPELLVRRAHDEVGVARPHGLIRRAHFVRRADRRRLLAGAPVFAGIPDRERQRGVEERGVDVLAAAGFPGADVGAEDRVKRKQRAADVGHRHAAFHRRHAGIAGDAHHAAHRLRHEVKAGSVGPRPALAEAGDAGIDRGAR